MKSIQTKFIVLILSCLLISSIIIGGAGIINSNAVINNDSSQIMNLHCTEKTGEINALLSRIEQSVKTLAVYAVDQLDSADSIKDPAYEKEYTKRLEEVAANAAENTEGAVAVYVRYNPEFTTPTSGLFWSKTELNGSFQRLTPTDLSSFSPTDVEHVGWYYIPVKSGKPIWMKPYMNENIKIHMISYVIPIYMNNQTVGVVGMDINFEVLTNVVSGMRVYNSGNAFLLDNQGTVMFHHDIPYGTPASNLDTTIMPMIRELGNGTSGSSLYPYTWKNVERKMAFRTLNNGMHLGITAPSREIDEARNKLVIQILIASALICAVAVTITVFMTRKMVQPLKELNIAAKKIAEGDLTISLSHQTKDEVGTLADSFQMTVNHLQKYISYINSLAYRDSLTGVKNKTAYDDMAKNMESRMHTDRPEFALVVMDINDLKHVNDVYGHDFGDMLIMDCCKIICKSFKRSPVYRIGGDEFVVILEGPDFENYSQLLEDFRNNIDEHNANSRDDSKVSIARGIAIYNYETDLVFGNVFKRADEAMYQNKADMKKKTN